MSQPRPLMAILGAVLGVAACQHSDERQAPPSAAAASAPATPSETRDPPKAQLTTALGVPAGPDTPSAPSTLSAPSNKEGPVRNVDAAGLTLKLHDNGHVTLVGKDRWGGAIDTTYENRDFLLKALPVLERSTSPEQVAALRKALAPPTEKSSGVK